MMIAAHVSSQHSCLHKAKMARTIRGCLTAQSQQESTEEPETNPSVPQQKEQLDTAEGKFIVEYSPDVDYEGSEPKNEPVA